MSTFKLIKSTTFKVKEASHTAYVVGYKGRALNLSTLSFVDELDTDNKPIAITVSADKSTVSVPCKVAVVKKPYLDAEGNTIMGLSIMPAFDLTVDAF